MVHKELTMLFEENPQHFNLEANVTESPNIIVCIKMCIEQLVSMKILKALDAVAVQPWHSPDHYVSQ
jgi:hypothetical protein